MFEVTIPRQQKVSHIACEDQRVGEPAEDAQGSAKQEAINHKPAIGLGNKFMDMFHFLKRSPKHFISKSKGSLVLSDFHRKVLFDAKMNGLPGYDVAQSQKSLCNSGNCALSRMGYGVAVGIDAERAIETALRWRVDIRF